jgi:hypothetical protein
MEQVSRVVEASPGINATAITKTLSVRKELVLEAIHLLTQSGAISVTKGPHGAHQHHFVAPFRQVEQAGPC